MEDPGEVPADAVAEEAGIHRAARIEGALRGAMGSYLGARGWTPRVVPYTGYGAPGWVRVFARVVLVPSGHVRSDREDGRGWRRFVSQPAPRAEVTVEVGGQRHVVSTVGDGYLDVRLEADLEPGWATAKLWVDDSDTVEARLRIVGPQARLGLLSDIDDTVMVTMVPRPLVAFRNAFLERESARRAVPGMADLYQQVLDAESDVFVVYLSTGAWNTAHALERFLDRHGFPAGPLLLTDWGPTADGWFRSGQTHKRTQLRRLFEELPQLQWLLVGDDGQHDPSLYAEAAASEPARVAGVVIRELGVTEQIVGHGTPIPRDALSLTGLGLPGTPVTGPHGFALAEALRDRGIVLTP